MCSCAYIIACARVPSCIHKMKRERGKKRKEEEEEEQDKIKDMIFPPNLITFSTFWTWRSDSPCGFVGRPVCLFICSSVFQSVFLSVCLSFYPSVYLSVGRKVGRSIGQSVGRSVSSSLFGSLGAHCVFERWAEANKPYVWIRCSELIPRSLSVCRPKQFLKSAMIYRRTSDLLWGKRQWWRYNGL